MATIYYEKDTDPDALKGQKVAILGFGSQGHAHALNLRDSGHDVRVGLRSGSKSRQVAEDAGLRVLDTADAVREADVVMVVLPDTAQSKAYADDIGPNLEPGNMLMFAHGFNIHFGTIAPPEGVDVTMIAPKGPGHLVRRTYEQGIGTPALIAVHQDATGKARERALAYAAGIGAARAGVLETTFKEETETDLFGEQSVLCGGASSLVQAGFETLVAAGYQPEIALLRVPARAQADRGPHLRRRPVLDAVLHLRHGRVRRLHARSACGERRNPRRDAPDPRRDPKRAVRQRMDRGGRRWIHQLPPT